LIQIFIRLKSSIDDLSLFLQLLGPVPKNQLGGGDHICLTILWAIKKIKYESERAFDLEQFAIRM
jgi:hypothetical protein